MVRMLTLDFSTEYLIKIKDPLRQFDGQEFCSYPDTTGSFPTAKTNTQTITEYILTGGIRFPLVLSNFPRSRYTGVPYTATLFTTMHACYN